MSVHDEPLKLIIQTWHGARSAYHIACTSAGLEIKFTIFSDLVCKPQAWFKNKDSKREKMSIGQGFHGREEECQVSSDGSFILLLATVVGLLARIGSSWRAPGCWVNH